MPSKYYFKRMPKVTTSKTITAKPLAKKESTKLWHEISRGNLEILDSKIFSETVLKETAEHLVETASFGTVFSLIDALPRQGRNFDWNVGSLLQHLDLELIIESLKHVGNLIKHHDSIGLNWVLGEFKSRDRFVVDFLYDSVRKATSSEAWWRAAFSLENLDIEDAVNLLKRSLKPAGLRPLNHYLERLSDKRSLIGILVLSNVENIQNIIYPKLREVFLTSSDPNVTIGCCWLLGRLKLIDDEISNKLMGLMSNRNYELKYYAFFALQNNATEQLRPSLEKALNENDPLIRKMAVRGLMSIGNEKSLSALDYTLKKEMDRGVIGDLCRVIYGLKNPSDKDRLLMEIDTCRNENGMIADTTDQWYLDPSIYDIFSASEDPENLCFDLILKRLAGKRIVNPVDLACGTGRVLWQIINNVRYEGSAFAVDASSAMCNFVEKRVRRERKYTRPVKIINCRIDEIPKNLPSKSSLIISSFGFPSRVFNQCDALKELKAIYESLTDDGDFFTIGWDETFNDELNEMWFKHIPDDIPAKDFEEWRRARSEMVSSPRNCQLSWFKSGLQVPLQFASLSEAARVMGYLFGRDAAKHVVQTSKTEWRMSLGITHNTKRELKKIITSYEKRSRNSVVA